MDKENFLEVIRNLNERESVLLLNYLAASIAYSEKHKDLIDVAMDRIKDGFNYSKFLDSED